MIDLKRFNNKTIKNITFKNECVLSINFKDHSKLELIVTEIQFFSNDQAMYLCEDKEEIWEIESVIRDKMKEFGLEKRMGLWGFDGYEEKFLVKYKDSSWVVDALRFSESNSGITKGEGFCMNFILGTSVIHYIPFPVNPNEISFHKMDSIKWGVK